MVFGAAQVSPTRRPAASSIWEASARAEANWAWAEITWLGEDDGVLTSGPRSELYIHTCVYICIYVNTYAYL